MKPDWDKLGMEYKDSSSVLIGDADCSDSREADDLGYATCPRARVTIVVQLSCAASPRANFSVQAYGEASHALSWQCALTHPNRRPWQHADVCRLSLLPKARAV